MNVLQVEKPSVWKAHLNKVQSRLATNTRLTSLTEIANCGKTIFNSRLSPIFFPKQQEITAGLNKMDTKFGEPSERKYG